MTKYFESEEFHKEIEEHKKRIEVARARNENAIPWISCGLVVVVFIYGVILLFLWARDNRKEKEQ